LQKLLGEICRDLEFARSILSSLAFFSLFWGSWDALIGVERLGSVAFPFGVGVTSTKKRIEEIYGGICIDSGSTAEMTPWMSNCECEYRQGIHLW